MLNRIISPKEPMLRFVLTLAATRWKCVCTVCLGWGGEGGYRILKIKCSIQKARDEWKARKTVAIIFACRYASVSEKKKKNISTQAVSSLYSQCVVIINYKRLAWWTAVDTCSLRSQIFNQLWLCLFSCFPLFYAMWNIANKGKTFVTIVFVCWRTQPSLFPRLFCWFIM